MITSGNPVNRDAFRTTVGVIGTLITAGKLANETVLKDTENTEITAQHYMRKKMTRIPNRTHNPPTLRLHTATPSQCEKHRDFAQHSAQRPGESMFLR